MYSIVSLSVMTAIFEESMLMADIDARFLRFGACLLAQLGSFGREVSYLLAMLGSLTSGWTFAVYGVCAPEELALDNRHTCSKCAASLDRVEVFFTPAFIVPRSRIFAKRGSWMTGRRAGRRTGNG